MVDRFHNWSLVRLLAAILYAVCILAPYTTLALSGGGTRGQCLTDDTATAHIHTSQAGHSHTSGTHGTTAHQHAEGAADADGTASSQAAPEDESQSGMCCGLLCVTGLAAALPPVLSEPLRAGRLVVAIDGGLDDRAPDQINRPPIA